MHSSMRDYTQGGADHAALEARLHITLPVHQNPWHGKGERYPLMQTT
jgi:hypothetical protein